MATTQDTADSDAAEIRMAEEDTFNEAPTSKDGQKLRHTGFEVSLSTETQSSEEIRSDRQQADTTRVGFNTDGSINYELSFATYDLFIEHALFNEFEFAHQLSGTISADSTNDQFTSDSTSNGPDFSPVVEGQKIKVSNFDSNVDGEYTVASVDTSTDSNHIINVDESVPNDVTGDDDEKVGYNFQTGTLSNDTTNDQFTVDTTTAGNPTFDGYQYGDYIKISGFSNDSNNGYFYITNVDTSTDTHKITVRSSLTDSESSVSGVKLGSRRLVNGTNLKSLYMEKEFTDLSGDAITTYPGQRVVGWDHSIEQQANITGSFTIQGMDENPNQASTQFAGTTDANSNEVYSSADAVPKFLFSGSEQPIQSFSHSMDNSPRTQAIVGQAQPLNIKAGQIGLTGDLSIYLSDPSLYKKYTDFTDESFGVVQEDQDGNGYVFGYEFVNFTDGDENPDSADSDVITNLSWEASKDNDDETGKTVQVFKVPNGLI